MGVGDRKVGREGGSKGEREGEREEFIFENIILICFKRTVSATDIS